MGQREAIMLDYKVRELLYCKVCRVLLKNENGITNGGKVVIFCRCYYKERYYIGQCM